MVPPPLLGFGSMKTKVLSSAKRSFDHRTPHESVATDGMESGMAARGAVFKKHDTMRSGETASARTLEKTIASKVHPSGGLDALIVGDIKGS